MLISMNWVNDFVDLSGLDLEKLIHQFTLSTAEVEDVYHMGGDIENVVVARILSVENHPDSKKLHLLKVDAGDKVYDCVCGAPNVREGMTVAFAREGGKVGGMAITCARIAGVESHGMCCSEKELGISADHSGLWEITDDLPLGTPVTEAYAIRDVVFEVDNKSLTNRPDLWGHYGIAREFAALTGRALKPVTRMDLTPYKDLAPIDIDVIDRELCFRYTGLKVRNITKKVSPVDMRIRLFYCGMRAINLLADLTNYLMLELGQPMHAFDCAKVDSIQVKRFDKPFDFETLDGVQRRVDENTLMICSKGEPVAIAGIMGGLSSEIEDDTDSLLLESANFDAVSVRKSSTRLGLRTDASMRYEKTLDPELTTTAIEHFMQLLTEIDPGVEIISAMTDVYVRHYDKIDLSFDKKYVDRYTGIDISNEQILNTLNALGFNASLSGETFTVHVPSWRATKDVTIKADIIEEITRIYGYDNFKITSTKSALAPVLRTVNSNDDRFAKDLLVQRYGLHEVHSYIWCDAKKYKELNIEIEDNVRVINAMTPDHVVLRRSMVPTMISYVNENKSYANEFGIFEIARVVEGLREDGLCNERKHLGVALYSRTRSEKDVYLGLRDLMASIATELKHRPFEFRIAEAKHNWQHPRNTAEIWLDNVCLGFITVIHPAVQSKIDKKAVVVAAELDMDAFSALPASVIRYDEPSKFPGIDIDLSLVVSDTQTYSALAAAWADVTPLLKKVALIDSYTGAVKSITLRFTFSSMEKTLSKTEVQGWVDTIVERLGAMGVTLR